MTSSTPLRQPPSSSWHTPSSSTDARTSTDDITAAAADAAAPDTAVIWEGDDSGAQREFGGEVVVVATEVGIHNLLEVISRMLHPVNELCNAHLSAATHWVPDDSSAPPSQSAAAVSAMVSSHYTVDTSSAPPIQSITATASAAATHRIPDDGSALPDQSAAHDAAAMATSAVALSELE